MPPIFPLEIEEIILDLLAEDDVDHFALKTCSLVCQAFLPRCRKHIFGSIILNPSDYNLELPTIYNAFERLLRETPEIAHCIHTLDYTIRNHNLTSPSIQESLKRISRLEFLTVRVGCSHSQDINWSNNPIRPALLHLLHLPTLTRFKVTGFKGFLVSDLIPCVNLKYLEIGRKTNVAAENTFPATLPDHPIRLNEFVTRVKSPDAIMMLCTARRPDGQPIIDFRSLPKITVGIEVHGQSEAQQELFRHCHFLTNANISCK